MPTIDATAAGADANSYVTAAEMTTYLDGAIPSAAVTAWGALSADDQARYLITACAMIDRAHPWLGQRVGDLIGTGQALEFPRASLMTRGGKANVEAYRGSGSYAVDERVKEAQMEQALFMVHQIAVAGDVDPVGGSTRAKLQAEGVASVSIGNTSESYTGKARGLCAAAEELLRPLIRKTSRM